MSLVRSTLDDRGVLSLTLDDPRTRNALSDQLLDELLEGLRSARSDDAVRVVVLRSSDAKVFSSGGDLKAFAGDVALIEKYDGLARFPALYETLLGLGKPTVCVADGDVLAGAFGLALACDLLVARAGVRFGCPEINVGVFPFMISALIYRSMPRAKANELMMTGELIDASEAHDLHVVNRIFEAADLEAGVDELLDRLASRSPLLMRLGKDALAATRDLPLEMALAHLRGQLALAFSSDDIREGVAAFREKREPRWSGR